MSRVFLQHTDRQRAALAALSGGPLGVQAVADRLGVSVSAARSTLATLYCHRVVERDELHAFGGRAWLYRLPEAQS